MCRGRELVITNLNKNDKDGVPEGEITQMRTLERPDIAGMLKSERENIIKRISEPFSKETVAEMKRIKDLHEREEWISASISDIWKAHENNLCDKCRHKMGCPNGLVSYGIPRSSCPVGIYEPSLEEFTRLHGKGF
jgi:hypothetical protein